MAKLSQDIRDLKAFAEKHGFDQVVLIARRVGDGGEERVVTYGKDRTHCAIAARMGDFLKYKVMGWPHDEQETSGREGS